MKLARLLIEGGTPAVPVFWLATEDHDFEEVSKVHLFDAAHQRVTLAAATPKDAGDSPVGPLAVDSYPVRELREALSGFPFGDDVAATIEAAYQPGRTMGQAFRLLLEEWLGRFGLLFVDPWRRRSARWALPCCGRRWSGKRS